MAYFGFKMVNLQVWILKKEEGADVQMNFSESFKYFVDAVGTNVTSYLKVTDQTQSL